MNKERKPITAWDRLYKETEHVDATYKYNHIEDGHSLDDGPKAMCKEQENDWSGADGWRKNHVYLDGSGCIVDS